MNFCIVVCCVLYPSKYTCLSGCVRLLDSGVGIASADKIVAGTDSSYIKFIM
jgi:hypothetical protein